MKKPQPVSKETVCSVCGLDWSRHSHSINTKEKEPAPTLEDCIKLLKADLAMAQIKTRVWNEGIPEKPYKIYEEKAIPWGKERMYGEETMGGLKFTSSEPKELETKTGTKLWSPERS